MKTTRYINFTRSKQFSRFTYNRNAQMFESQVFIKIGTETIEELYNQNLIMFLLKKCAVQEIIDTLNNFFLKDYEIYKTQYQPCLDYRNELRTV